MIYKNLLQSFVVANIFELKSRLQQFVRFYNIWFCFSLYFEYFWNYTFLHFEHLAKLPEPLGCFKLDIDFGLWFVLKICSVCRRRKHWRRPWRRLSRLCSVVLKTSVSPSCRLCSVVLHWSDVLAAEIERCDIATVKVLSCLCCFVLYRAVVLYWSLLEIERCDITTVKVLCFHSMMQSAGLIAQTKAAS